KCIAAFDIKVKGYDPYVSAEIMNSFGVEKEKTLEDMLPPIDFLTIHCPLTAETKGMVGKKELALMKKGAYVINTARGGIVDEKALYEALLSGQIAGAALDVWELEPPDPADPLLNHPNVLATPHYAGTTEESLYRCGMAAVEEVLATLQGKRPKYPVNPEVWDKKSKRGLRAERA
ncbi:MAG: 3-phosphoglycerate dehydrogenase, partial [Deltaproteobacteria bacterium]|nr:3-phosphoglycerate dehydrogenase [Deltaproteobacteria bacterium]